ncbi:MAG: hypothetical protein PHO01_08850 [Desulfotomaculaceae bacterium]|nr:hypothetical protein [Desulfotomaculaceae bacterium]
MKKFGCLKPLPIRIHVIRRGEADEPAGEWDAGQDLQQQKPGH